MKGMGCFEPVGLGPFYVYATAHMAYAKHPRDLGTRNARKVARLDVDRTCHGELNVHMTYHL